MKITEEQIRPQKIFDEYLKLAELDTITYFQNADTVHINCPACDGQGGDWANKSGFNYKLCKDCLSIYVSPRPILKAFNNYYTDSPSTKYWATTFYKVTESARREKIWKPKAKLIKDRLIEFEGKSPIKYIIDIGGGYGVFDEEIQKIHDINIIVIEPSIHLANICRQKELNVIEKFMEEISYEDLPKDRKCFVSFELFEHLHNPTKFLEVVYNNMQLGDLFIFTTLSSMGIDIQLLGINSKAVSPPHHLNFMNPKSITKILEKIGFSVLEAITPGKLDMDILVKNIQFINDPFWINLIKYSTVEEIDNFQNFVSTSGLSSHMMITCIK